MSLKLSTGKMMPMIKSRRRRSIILLLLGSITFIALLYRYGEHWLREVLLYLSKAAWARQAVSNFSLAWLVASRFVAGEDIESAIAAARDLNARGMSVAMDYLGESVTNVQDTIDARDEILYLLDCIHETGVDAYVSIKLSQLGVKIDEELALENVRRLLQRARQYHNEIHIDMEESALVDTTLAIYRALRHDYGFANVGAVIQSYLYRSDDDVRRLVEEGAQVRLVKGAYAEPPEIAYPDKADTDASFVRLMQMLLDESARQNGVYLAVATHDEEMIQATIDYARRHNIPAGAYEFQMLYGVRRELQQQLVDAGYQVRVYVPYGTAWYPYFMRRLAERPANLWFFISSLFRR
ncbi:MAG TPA: proline dehydrogenase family protein [Anaerolineae bacterium]